MIANAERVVASRRLVLHLLNAEHNERVVPGSSRGLAARDTAGAIAEMDLLSFHNRPLYHVHANPDPGLGRDMSEQEWDRFWRRFEHAHGLELQPYCEVRHVKKGRSHRHRAYLLSRPDKTIVDLKFDYLQREMVNRITEVETGQPITVGRHNRWVVARLKEQGRFDIVEKLEAAGITTCARPVALSPKDRQADERRQGIRKHDVQDRAWRAWSRSDSLKAFVAALRAEGLALAMGNKLPVLVASDHGVHRLAQQVAAGAKRAGLEGPKAKEVYARIEGMILPTVDEAKALIAKWQADLPSEQPEKPAQTQRQDHHPNAPARDQRWPDQDMHRVLNAPDNRRKDPPAPLSHHPPSWSTALVHAQGGGARRDPPETAPPFAVRGRRHDTSGLPRGKLDRRLLEGYERAMLDVGRRVARFRQQIDEEVAEAARKRRLAKRLENAIDGISYPSIGQPSWREQWRARMAGLPEDYASRLRWVEQLGRNELRVVTKDAREYLVSENRISREDADLDDIELMLTYAANRGWKTVIVTGNDPEWCRAAEQAAVAAGFRLAQSAAKSTTLESPDPRKGPGQGIPFSIR